MTFGPFCAIISLFNNRKETNVGLLSLIKNKVRTIWHREHKTDADQSAAGAAPDPSPADKRFEQPVLIPTYNPYLEPEPREPRGRRRAVVLAERDELLKREQVRRWAELRGDIQHM